MEYKILLAGKSQRPLNGLYDELVARGHHVERTDFPGAYQVFLKDKPQAIVIDCSRDEEAALKLMRLVRMVDMKTGMVLVAPDPCKADERTESMLVWSVHPAQADPDSVATEIEQACELAVIPKDKEIELSEAADVETMHLRKIRSDILNETGFFRPLKDLPRKGIVG